MQLSRLQGFVQGRIGGFETVFGRVVKPSALTGALVCVLAVLVVAGPALSLRPYRPEPVQFSMPAGGEAALQGIASRRGPGVVSVPLRAAKRFNAVGLTWRGGPRDPRIAMRTRREGSAWSPWSPVSAHAEDAPDARAAEPLGRGTTAPTWAGEADWVQYRSSRRLPGARLHFVNVRGTATAADRRRTALRRAVNTGVISVSRLLEPSDAGAASRRPSIVSRSGWGASKCRPREPAEYGEVKAAFVHHTVNNNDYTREEARDVVLAVCLYHRNSNGWDDIGYNFLVDRFGTIYEGRAGGTSEAVIGAQAQGYNAESTGIANLGTFTSERQTSAAMRSMAALIRWKLPLHGAPTTGRVGLTSAGGPSNRYPAGRVVRLNRVSGHRDTGATSCPGSALYAQLPQLRRMVAGAAPPGSLTQLDADLEVRRDTVRYRRPAPLTGRLTGEDGRPLAGMPVTIQFLKGGRFRKSSSATTDADGAFTATLRPRRTRTVRVRFRGSPGLLSSTSAPLVLKVKPIVRIKDRPSVSTAGTRVVIRGSVSPRKRRVFQVLQREEDGRFRRVGVTALKVGRRGGFRGSFVPDGSGTYRFYVVAKGDTLTARSASRRYLLTVARTRGGGVVAP